MLLKFKSICSTFEYCDEWNLRVIQSFCFVVFIDIYSVAIENCIICEKAIIRTGSTLKNCLVGPNHEVEANTIKDKAHLTNSDGYMEIE